MLTLSKEPLDDTALRKALFNPQAGALVVFEGTVRDSNAGREVRQLEYEGTAKLAENEFEKIVTEARAQFEFLEARCVHRVGILNPGDVAVWIGVTSAHRSAAFAACKYLIDELKKHDLLMDGEIAISQQEAPDKPFVYRGFQMVNQEKLQDMRGDILREWNKNGMLALIYSHIMSLDLMRTIFARQVHQGTAPVLPTSA